MSIFTCGAKSATKISRIFAFTATAALLAGCSGSVDRFADYPSIATNSVSKKETRSAAVESVESSPLTGDRVATARPSWQNAPSPNAGYTPPAPAYNPAPQQQAYNPPAPSYQPAQSGTITVQPGQTMYSLARANGMTVSQLAGANNISAPYTLSVGQRLVVPGASSPVSPQPTVQTAAAPVQHSAANVAPQQAGGSHVVRAGETLYSLGRTYNVHPHEIARANGLSTSAGLNVGQRVTIPGAGARSSSPIANSAPTSLPQQNLAAREPVQAAPQPLPGQVEQQRQPVTEQVAQEADDGNGSGIFRWPVKGRVISKFGSKPNNTKNEGINIAVPEGTAVRAAEAGVVAYAGNELKGYGNLVLIRHQNGWVTAYAHNKELTVKRGDTVRRGDVIAKAGQTGSVTSPQVHFEVRQGATPVDPMKYLTSQTASN